MSGGGPVLVEFAIPFWGDPALLALTLGSLVAQDDPDWAAVVVDDASPRGEGARAAVEALADERVHYVRNADNLGITRNFQRCMDLARGDYVVLPGDDDIVLPRYVSVLRATVAELGRVEVVQPRVVVIDATGRPVMPLGDRVKEAFRRRWPSDVALVGDRLAASLLDANWLYFPACAFRRDSARAVGFDPRWRVVEDLALVLGILQRGGRLVLVDQPGLAYRRHAGSVSSREAVTGGRFAEERRFFAEQRSAAQALEWGRAARAARRHATSRLHALTLLPGSGGGSRGELLRHVVR